MGENRHNLENLKGKNPFLVPEGYMEGLTERIMSQLPEETLCDKKSLRTPIITRLRPWIAIASAVAGIAFFINVFIGLDNQTDNYKMDSLRVQSQVSSESMSEMLSNLDEDYIEYLESQYSDFILEEEMAKSE